MTTKKNKNRKTKKERKKKKKKKTEEKRRLNFKQNVILNRQFTSRRHDED